MGNLGQLRTDKSIENAMREIRDWLFKLKISGLNLLTNYDPRLNIAVLSFKYNDKAYEFRSTKQKNCRLNMHAIARVMESKVRAHLMGIEDFDKSMVAYLQLEDHSGASQAQAMPANERNYVKLGISALASNEELQAHYKKLCRTFHPDMALSEYAKEEFQKRMAEINEAWAEIKKERGL